MSFGLFCPFFGCHDAANIQIVIELQWFFAVFYHHSVFLGFQSMTTPLMRSTVFWSLRVVGFHDDDLGERPRLARVVFHPNAASRLRRYRLLRPFGHHAAARRERRGDEQRRIALVGEEENMLRAAVLHDSVEVEHRFLKDNLGRGGFLGQHLKRGGKDYRCHDDGFSHGLLVLVLSFVVRLGFEEFGVVAQIVCFINELFLG